MIHEKYEIKAKRQSIEQAEPNKQMGQEKIDKHSTWSERRRGDGK